MLLPSRVCFKLFLLKIILIYDTPLLSGQPLFLKEATCRYTESEQNPAETIVCLFESAVFFVIQAKNDWSVWLLCSEVYIEQASIICFWFYAKSPSTKKKKNDQRVPRMICGKSKFFQLASIFLFSLTIHTNPRVEILWWENAPLQSISKRTKQSKKSR